MNFFSEQTLYVILVPGCLHVSKAQQLLRILVATKIRCNSGANHSSQKIKNKNIAIFWGDFFALIFIQIYDAKNFSLLDNTPNYLPSWMLYPKEIAIFPL